MQEDSSLQVVANVTPVKSISIIIRRDVAGITVCVNGYWVIDDNI